MKELEHKKEVERLWQIKLELYSKERNKKKLKDKKELKKLNKMLLKWKKKGY